MEFRLTIVYLFGAMLMVVPISKGNGTNCGPDCISYREELDILKRIIAITDSIAALSNSIIPLGFIYIQYKQQSSPSALWPKMKWADVTGEFSGQFFRALGGNSASFDQVQESCAPRISSIENIDSNSYAHNIDLPTKGWSPRLFTGKWEQMGTATSFHIADCEVRPINSAVKIWKRVE